MFLNSIFLSSNTQAANQPISGMLMWLDATTISTGAVSSWTDMSGNGYHATQSDELLQPVCEAAQLNGKNTVLFELQFLDLPAGVFSIANGDNTCFVVSKIEGELGTAQYDWGLTEGGSLRHYSRFSATAGNNLFLSSTSNTGGVSVSGATNTNYLIKSMYKSGTTQSIQINNGTAATNTNGANESGVDNGNIGAFADGSGPLLGHIAEILWYNTKLTAGQILHNNQYLSAKWGITIA